MPVLRLAPTPSGLLHLGNLINFAITAAAAQALSARLLLRIDDLDQARLRPAYLADIHSKLQWLLPAEAPNLLAHARSQHQRLPRYTNVLVAMAEAQLVYACSCTRRTLAEHSPELSDVNQYPGTCRDLGLSLEQMDAVWRTYADDIVVRQRNGQPSYQLASMLDDVDFGVTHIVRGEDLRASTNMQRVLAKALEGIEPGCTAFAKTRTFHHPLVLDAAGRKLSKSSVGTPAPAADLQSLRVETVFAQAGELLGRSNVKGLTELTQVISNSLWDDD